MSTLSSLLRSDETLDPSEDENDPSQILLPNGDQDFFSQFLVDYLDPPLVSNQAKIQRVIKKPRRNKCQISTQQILQFLREIQKRPRKEWTFQSKDLTVSKDHKTVILSVFVEMGILERTGNRYEIVREFIVF